MIVFLRNLVVKDLWLKLFSLALGILIWVLVEGSITKDRPILSALIGRAVDESVMTVPVSLPPADARIVSVSPSEVQVTLRGDPKVLKQLTIDDVRAQVNLTGIETADGMRRTIEMILPPDISYVHLTPKEVEVQVSPRNK